MKSQTAKAAFPKIVKRPKDKLNYAPTSACTTTKENREYGSYVVQPHIEDRVGMTPQRYTEAEYDWRLSISAPHANGLKWVMVFRKESGYFAVFY